MSWKIQKRLKDILSTEEGSIRKEWGGKRSIALVYPNTYAVGMGNLAVHALYRMLNGRPDIVCERAFLPDKREMKEHLRTDTPVLSIESQRPLADFDAVAFTISFENDLLNIIPMLSMSNIPHLAEARAKDMPLLIAGGAAPTLNPRPILAIFDAVVLGEAEAFTEDLIPLLAESLPKNEAVAEITKLKGVTVHGSRFTVHGVTNPESRIPNPGLPRRFIPDLDPWPVQTVIHGCNAEFGNMHLIEVQRGCPRRCKFCAMPSLYDPPRSRSAASVLKMVDEGMRHGNKFGLIGAHILAHPEFADIARGIHSRGATFSPSSVHIDDIDDEKAAFLSESGHMSVALGVEAGRESLRRSIGKNVSDRQVVEAAGLLSRHGVTRLRLYFMMGLPGETDDDVAGIVDISSSVEKIARKEAPRTARSTSVDIKISPFVPKPGTVFEDEKFAGEREIKRKMKMIKKLIGDSEGLKVYADSPHEAAVESLLSKGDEGTIEFLESEARKLAENVRGHRGGHR